MPAPVIPTTPLLMVQICLFLVPLIKFNRMLGLMVCIGNFKFSSREFSGFSVSLKIRYFQLVQLKSVHQFLFSFVCACLPVLCPPPRQGFSLVLAVLELWFWQALNSEIHHLSLSLQCWTELKCCHHQAVLFFLIKMF